MLRTFLILLLCLWFNTGVAQLSEKQNAQIDSLKNVIESAKHDSSVVKAYIAWDNIIYVSDPELDHELNKKIIEICNKNLADELSAKSKAFFQKILASSYNNIGTIYQRQSNYKQALDYHTKSLKIKEEIGDKNGIALSYNNLGIIAWYQGNYKQALNNYEKSIKIEEETGNKSRIATSLNNIGLIYDEQGDYAKAIDYYTRSLKIKEELGNKRGIAISLNNIGFIYDQQGDYVKAMDYYSRSLKIDEELGDKDGIASSLNNIGDIYSEGEDYTKAIDYYTNSLKIVEELGDKNGIAISLNSIGSMYKEQGDYSKALEKSTKALSIAQEIGNVESIKLASENLWETYKKLGKHRQALEMHELTIELRDSMLSIENKEAIIQQEFKYKYEKEQALADAKHQEQMALSAEREKRQQLIAYSAGGGLVMVLAFAFFVFNRLQVTRRQKTIIEQQKELVEEQKKDITDSIQYAENIQKALLPAEEDLSVLPEGFVLFHPKDIVSGDFYWMQHYSNNVYLAACDCTGHGVPGAFMSMIGSSLLDEAVVEKGLTQPNEIFFEVRKGFINALKQTGEKGQQKDGMDATLIVWDKNNKLQFSVANNPLFLIRKGELLETKPDRQPVGFFTGEQKPFTHHELSLEKGDTVYICSDGYPDQFGGKRDKKFMMKNFKKLLLSIQDKTMNEQKGILETTMAEWKGDTEQVDDILVMGVRF